MLQWQIFSTFVVGAVLTSPTSSPKAAIRAERHVLQSNYRFTTNLYRVLANGTTGNVLFSPISVHALLSMAYQGAQGTTAQQFAKALQLYKPQVAAEGYRVMMDRLNSTDNVTLSMANRVYLKEGAKLVESFKNSITNKFLSEVQLLDFTKNVESAKIINDWVEEQTHEKIKDLISQDDLDELTRMVLVNAIYFKGNWKHQFEKELTVTEPFYVSDVDKVDVEMMHTYDKFNYKDDKTLDAQILEMAYCNQDLRMIILLPNQRNGIKELEEKLVKVKLTELTREMWLTDVDVSMPKFHIEQTTDLEDSLTKLGLGEIFDKANANFKGMVELGPSENLYVNRVLQKAFIEVNEEGAEAAAATAVFLMPRFLSEEEEKPKVTFTANHPFIFILSGRRVGQLFMGRFSKPKPINNLVPFSVESNKLLL